MSGRAFPVGLTVDQEDAEGVKETGAAAQGQQPQVN